jgi:hypothetical protein
LTSAPKIEAPDRVPSRGECTVNTSHARRAG